mmetsp:Transcript_10575/g.30947  ORF Transcript_10575/g.30947 Transcript_10575/m.30947 type:complete len:115 (-) Transcript_10575:2226-2570(-)
MSIYLYLCFDEFVSHVECMTSTFFSTNNLLRETVLVDEHAKEFLLYNTFVVALSAAMLHRNHDNAAKRARECVPNHTPQSCRLFSVLSSLFPCAFSNSKQPTNGSIPESSVPIQ